MQKGMGEDHRKLVSAILILSFVSVVLSATDSNDVRILNEIRKGLENPELLKWPDIGNDPCGTPLWPHVYCSGNRVSQIQVQNLGLKGPLPQDFNQLTELSNLGLQRNHFNGKLPTFKGLKKLTFAYLGSNEFDTIPSDFTEGLDALEVLSLENNPLNKTTGWSIPIQLKDAAQLKNLSLSSCNLVGPIPDYLGTMPSLVALKLAYNSLTGGIPETFNQSGLQILWLNNQNSGTGLSGTIDVIAKMTSLAQIWLHGNQFTGTIPADIGNLVSLWDLNLNQNQLSGPIPNSLADKELLNLDLSNNYFMGPIPKFKTANASYKSNAFCQSDPGFPCAPEVTALIDFLGGFNYPTGIASVWKGNNPCGDSWTGLSCSSNGPNRNVSIINLPSKNLTGTLRPSIAMLDSLTAIHLQANNITGVIPTELAGLKSLKLLDLSGNNILLPLPQFSSTVKLVIDGNPQLNGNQPPSSSPPGSPSSKNPSDQSKDSNGGGHAAKPPSKKPKLLVIVVPLACFAVLVLLAIPLSMYYCKKKKRTAQAPNSYVVHPRDPSDPDDMIKIVVSNNGNVSNVTEGSSQSMHSSVGESHVIESGNLVISVQILRDVTKNFAPENELGRGGFGTVYKGELYDGTKIAVKRMEASMITNKALDEFQSEIAVLTKVRHRHLVSLLGYSIEGNERLLVYEYMPQGALSRHLFQWENFKLEPLSWKRRLNIALDVARGMEYLHTLAHQSFIHRDLKSSNILLGDEFRAKVSDFGLVKLAPDGKRSVVTRLAGTFGYLAPEYAVTGKITTKADVFSFGVVLLELLTGLSALDEDRPEEIRYLAAWFWHVKSNRGKIIAAIDHALEPNEETLESILIVAELAGHCTARDPNQRPDMGHAVNVLSPLVEKWKPFADDPEEYSGIDYSLPLTQMVKGWQESESKDYSYAGLDDSKGSIPQGIADSFNSAR